MKKNPHRFDDFFDMYSYKWLLKWPCTQQKIRQIVDGTAMFRTQPKISYRNDHARTKKNRLIDHDFFSFLIHI